MENFSVTMDQLCHRKKVGNLTHMGPSWKPLPFFRNKGCLKKEKKKGKRRIASSSFWEKKRNEIDIIT